MTTITADRLAEIVTELNAYEAEHPEAVWSDVWQDVILNLPEYDESQTAIAENMFVLTDGTEIVWGSSGRQWLAGRIGNTN